MPYLVTEISSQIEAAQGIQSSINIIKTTPSILGFGRKYTHVHLHNTCTVFMESIMAADFSTETIEAVRQQKDTLVLKEKK